MVLVEVLDCIFANVTSFFSDLYELCSNGLLDNREVVGARCLLGLDSVIGIR